MSLNRKTFLLLSLLFGMSLVYQTLPAQFLYWDYYNILDENRESGMRPSMKMDASGTVHISYWHAEEDKLIYAWKTLGGSWSREYIDPFGSNGYVSSMVLDANNVPHLVYMERINNEAFYRYAYRVGPGNWAIEAIPNPDGSGWGEYGPNGPNISTQRLNPGASILLKGGIPQILFFDARMASNAFPTCLPSSDYELRLIQATKINGQWFTKDFGEIPDIHQSCGTGGSPIDLPSGDRYGEFPNILQRNNGDLEALCTSMFNNNVVRFQSTINDTTWAYSTLDTFPTTLNPPPAPNYWGNWATRFYTYHGLAAEVDHNDNVHMVYSSSLFFGQNFYQLPFTNRLVYKRIIDPDSTYEYDFGIGGSMTYRNHSDICTRGTDSIYIVYTDFNSFQLLTYESLDSGQTWIQDTVSSLVASSQSPIQILGDSLYVAYFDSYTESLILASRHLGGGDWQFDRVTESEHHGESFDAKILTVLGDTLSHIVYNNAFNGDLFYGLGSSSSAWAYNQEKLSGSGGNARSVSIDLAGNGDPIIVYGGGSTVNARLATHSGGFWQYEIVDSSANVTFTDLAVSALDTIHFAYFDANRHCLRYLYRHVNESNWHRDSIDCDSNNVGHWPSLALDGETPHISYYDDTELQLKYATRNPITRVWDIDTVYSSVSSGAGKFGSLKLDQNGLPKIAFLDEQNTDIILSEKTLAGVWEHSWVDTSQIANIGKPTELVIDLFNNVWIAYNYNYNLDRAKLMHRDSTWQEVAVNSNGQIADEFHFEIIGGDLFLAGKKTALQNTGLAMLHAPNGLFVYANEPSDLSQFISIQNFPNPFNGSTTFRIGLQKAETISLEVFDLHGRKIETVVQNQKMGEGQHEIKWEATDLAPGIYIYVLENGKSKLVKKMLIGY